MAETKAVLSKDKDFFSKDYFEDTSLISAFRRYWSKTKKSNYIDHQSVADNPRLWRPIIKIIKKHHKKGNFLDIGCAFGLLLKYVSPYFKEIYGYDISEYAIERAKKNAPTANLAIGNLNTDIALPYEDEYFDMITALDVLEHTESIESSLRKIVQKLKNDGILIISMPIRGTFWGKAYQIFDVDKSHINVLRNEKQILDIINRVGLKVIEKSYGAPAPWGEIKGIGFFLRIVLQKNL